MGTMNKIIIFAVMALAVSASSAPIEDKADSAKFQAPGDTEEVAGLTGDMVAFSDYCKRSRNHIYDRINTSQTYASAMIGSAEIQANLEERLAKEDRKMQEKQTQLKNPFDNFITIEEKSGHMAASSFGHGLKVVFKPFIPVFPEEQTCNLVKKYKSKIRAMFDEAKAEIVASTPALANVEFETVPCLTTSRVMRVDSFCQIAKNSRTQFNSVIGPQTN